MTYTFDANGNRLTDVNGLTYVYDNNGNLLNDGVNAYTYDSANRLKTLSNQSTVSSYQYSGLGDRLSQTVNPSTGSGQAQTTNYTLDLNAGLTQVLNDGTNTYIYGLGRIAQVNTTTLMTDYFLTDALGSVRQLTNASGQVTLMKAYTPYGETRSSVGSGASIYSYTGEQQDASGLTYLRARYYASGTGRFLTKDPSNAEANLYLYAGANPMNRTDPSGLFSKELIEKNISIDRFASSSKWKDHSKWGFYYLLRNAENGDIINAAVVDPSKISIPGDRSLEIWDTPRTIREVNCEKIMVGSQFLEEYYTSVVDKGWMPWLLWRDTTPALYRINRNGSIRGVWDGFDNDSGTYPDFIGVSVGVANYGEYGYLLDMYGNKYLAVSPLPYSVTVGISYIEGYLCDWSLSSWQCSAGKPSAAEIEKAVSGICAGPQLLFFAGYDLGALCKDMSLTNWNSTSSISTFYAGVHVGGGISGTVTIPLSWFGIPPSHNQNWHWLIDNRRRYGITWDSLALWR